MRYRAKTEQFHKVKHLCNQAILLALKDRNITIPFPQREVRTLL